MASGVWQGLTLVAVVLGIWLIGKLLDRSRAAIAPDRPESPYRAYTKQFDLVCRGREVEELLRSDRSERQFAQSTEIHDHLRRKATASAAYERAVARPAVSFAQLDGAAVCFLLDLSGSLVNDLPEIAGELRGLCARLTDAGINCAAYGFTTRSWRGGRAREKWQMEDRPPYPGRLCDLLHVVCKEFGEASDPRDWAGILRADLLKENVDGEAIQWASDRLSSVEANTRLLVMLSDGAPVDDSTLHENGSGILFRHWQGVVAEIVARDDLEIAAIGIMHDVSAVIPNSTTIEMAEDLERAFCGLLERIEHPHPGSGE